MSTILMLFARIIALEQLVVGPWKPNIRDHRCFVVYRQTTLLDCSQGATTGVHNFHPGSDTWTPRETQGG